MANLNYVGSLANRFMQFRTALAAAAGVAEDLFSSIVLYIPKSQAKDNFSTEYADAIDGVTATKFLYIDVTVDNYATVFSNTGLLNSQWMPLWNDNTNFNAHLQCVIFYDTDDVTTDSANFIKGAAGLEYKPLSLAFEKTYFLGYFKILFDKDYMGYTAGDADAKTVNNYFPLSICLAGLCASNALSASWHEVHVNVPEVDGMSATDARAAYMSANVCGIMGLTVPEESAFKWESATKDDFAKYFWTCIRSVNDSNAAITVHDTAGNYMIPVLFGSWFTAKSSTKTNFIPNKFARIRLTGTKTKPTGLPSVLNAAVYDNLLPVWYETLDEKKCGYFISIANDSDTDCMLTTLTNQSGTPIIAKLISTWIDYTSSQDMAKYSAARATLTKPVLANQDTYTKIQNFLASNVGAFAGTSRVQNFSATFPPLAEAKKGNWFEGTAVWTADYVDDFEGCKISGSIQLI